MSSDNDKGEQERLSRSRKLISINLKRMYQEDSEDDIPDRFADLIKRLEASEEGDKDDK